MPEFTKVFKVTYHTSEEHWLNVYNLELTLRNHAPGGCPYSIEEIPDPTKITMIVNKVKHAYDPDIEIVGRFTRTDNDE